MVQREALDEEERAKQAELKKLIKEIKVCLQSSSKKNRLLPQFSNLFIYLFPHLIEKGKNLSPRLFQPIRIFFLQNDSDPIAVLSPIPDQPMEDERIESLILNSQTLKPNPKTKSTNAEQAERKVEDAKIAVVESRIQELTRAGPYYSYIGPCVNYTEVEG
jgi:hypothetical protein